MKRRKLIIQNKAKNLGIAIKRLRYIKADKEKIRNYIITLLVLISRNDPTEKKEGIKEVKKSLHQKR